jgi:hypothetical protein
VLLLLLLLEVAEPEDVDTGSPAMTSASMSSKSSSADRLPTNFFFGILSEKTARWKKVGQHIAT